MITRRFVISGLIAAPMIVPYSRLMKIPRLDISDFITDGVALRSMAHPFSNTTNAAMDLSEASLEWLWMELRKSPHCFKIPTKSGPQ